MSPPLVDRDALLAACRAGLGGEPPRVAADVAGGRALLAWLVARVARRRMSGADVHAGYCTRTPREVIAQACVPFTAPCADLSGVAALLLASAGFPVTLVLGGISRALRPVKFQCGLEVAIGDGSWIAGFGVGRSFFYEGRYLPVARRPWVFRRAPPVLSLDRPFLEYFDGAGRAGVANLVPGYDLDGDLRHHVRRASWLSFRFERLRAGGVSPVALDVQPRWEAA